MRRPLVVGVLNVTPDSFFDGGVHQDPVEAGRRLIDEGADWLDIGGESTRPGAQPVDEEEECRRVLPVIEALSGTIPLSIDTFKPGVARRAALAGATVLNDVTGLRDPEMAEISADFHATVIMHSRGTPATMGQLTHYGDLIEEVRSSLVEAANRAMSPHVWIDPGLGFAKTAQQSLALLSRLDRLVDTGWPVLIGASRKSFIGHALGLPKAEQRLAGSLAVAAHAARAGVGALRVHDVAATRQLLDMLAAIDGSA